MAAKDMNNWYLWLLFVIDCHLKRVHLQLFCSAAVNLIDSRFDEKGSAAIVLSRSDYLTAQE